MLSFISLGLRRMRRGGQKLADDPRVAGGVSSAIAEVPAVLCLNTTIKLHEQQHGGQLLRPSIQCVSTSSIHIGGVVTQSAVPQAAGSRGPAALNPGWPATQSSSAGDELGRPGVSASPAPSSLRLRRQRGDDLLRVFDQAGAVADQAVAAAGQRVVDRAGHGEHLAPGLGGQARGDQRARTARPPRSPGSPAHSPAMMRLRLGKCAGSGAGAGQVFADHGAGAAMRASRAALARG